MGAFYHNALFTSPAEDVAGALQGSGASGLVLPLAPALTVAYPYREIDVASLSRELRASALFADLHDSDVLWLKIWAAGNLVHEYCNIPAYFAQEFREIGGVSHGRVVSEDGDEHWIPDQPSGVAAEPFLPFAIGEPDAEAFLAALSNRVAGLSDSTDHGTYVTDRGTYVFADQLHRDAMAALGLPPQLLATGYVYLSDANNIGIDYSAFIPFGDAVRPDPEAPQPVSRFTEENLALLEYLRSLRQSPEQ